MKPSARKTEIPFRSRGARRPVEGFAAGHAPARCTQMEFTALLNMLKVTAISWENGTREPSGAAMRLLAVAKHHPEALQAS